MQQIKLITLCLMAMFFAHPANSLEAKMRGIARHSLRSGEEQHFDSEKAYMKFNSDHAAHDTTEAQSCERFTFNPGEASRSYSSVFQFYPPGTGHARSMLGSEQAWSAAQAAQGEWMIMDMGMETSVVGVVLQARKDKPYEYVKTFKAQYSSDGTSWTDIPGIFVGDSKFTSEVEAIFPTKVEARYVKLVVQSWNAWVSMRAAALLCVPCKMHMVNPPEAARTYSSVHLAEAPGVGHARSMLEGPQAWSASRAAAGEFIVMDLGAPFLLSGVTTQARTDKPYEFVKSLNVQYSHDGSSWHDIPGTFPGSSTFAELEAKFPASVNARYVKLLPRSWQYWISMRAGALVCDATTTTTTTTTTAAPPTTTTTTTTTTMAPTTTVTAKSTTTTTSDEFHCPGWKLIGCKARRAGTTSPSVTEPNMTRDVCLEFCKGIDSESFGLEGGDTCYCFPYEFIDPKAPVDMAGCDLPCSGDLTQMCGGEDKALMYAIDDCQTEIVRCLNGSGIPEVTGAEVFESNAYGKYTSCKNLQTAYGDNVNNKYCDVQCIAGFKLVRNDIGCHLEEDAIGEPYASFSGDAECAPYDCGEPDCVAHAINEEGAVMFPNSVKYTCALGYTTDGTPHGDASFFRSCLATGSLEDPQSCLPVVCGAAPNDTNAVLTSPYEVYNFEREATYMCKEGYTLDGDASGKTFYSKQCLAGGKFSNLWSCIPISCGPVKTYANATLKSPVGGFYATYPMELTYMCEEGYSVDIRPQTATNNFFVSTCTEEGKYSVQESECKKISCLSPLEMNHSSFEADEFLFYKEKVVYNCDAGYTTDSQPKGPGNANFTVVCGSDGVFVEQPKECLPVQCPNTPVVPNASLTEGCANNPCVFLEAPQWTCDPGYSTHPKDDPRNRTNQDLTVECLANGKFETPATCVNIDNCLYPFVKSPGDFGSCVDNAVPTGDPDKDYTTVCETGYEVTKRSRLFEGSPMSDDHCTNINDCPARTSFAYDCGGPDAGDCMDARNAYSCNCSDGYEVVLLKGANNTNQTCIPKACGVVPNISDSTFVHPPFSLTMSYIEATKTPITPHHLVLFEPPVNYTCDSGFTLTGNASGTKFFTMACITQAGVVAMTEPQKCLPVTCGAPYVINNSMPADEVDELFYAKSFENRTLWHACDEGYTNDTEHAYVQGAGFYEECKADGTKSPPLSCLPVSCGAPPAIAFANVTSTAPVHFGDAVEYLCLSGYSLDGSVDATTGLITCDPDGHHSGIVPCEPVKCGLPPSNLTEFHVAPIPDHVSKLFVYPEVAEYKIFSGYSLGGAPDGDTTFPIKCLPAGAPSLTDQLNQILPRVMPVQCGTPPFVSHSSYDTTEKVYMDEVVYSCDKGYSTDGEAASDTNTNFTITCLANGSFTPKAQCKPVVCHNLPKPNFTLQLPTTATVVFQQEVGFECAPGYTLNGLMNGTKGFTVECQFDGSFSEPATCLNIDNCLYSNCTEYGTCVDNPKPTGNHVEDHKCECHSGFKEVVTTFRTCVNINDCPAGACEPGTCEDLINDYKCHCPSGYYNDTNTEKKWPQDCFRQTCGSPPPEKYALSSEEEVLFESTATYKCETGYTLTAEAFADDDFTIGCMAGAVFTKKALFSLHNNSCEPVHCGAPPVSENLEDEGVSKKDDVVFPEVVVYTCETGYTVDGTCTGNGTYSRTCAANGDFEFVGGVEKKCLPVLVGTPSLPNAIYNAKDMHYPEMQAVTCKRGYSLDPRSPTLKNFTLRTKPDCTFAAHSNCQRVSCGKPAIPSFTKLSESPAVQASFCTSSHRETADIVWTGKETVTLAPNWENCKAQCIDKAFDSPPCRGWVQMSDGHCYQKYDMGTTPVDFVPRGSRPHAGVLSCQAGEPEQKATFIAGPSCPSGWKQVGEPGADVGGCGLESCNRRYGAQADSPTTCAAHCAANPRCKGFNWAPLDGDQNHPGKRACTIYPVSRPNKMWKAVSGKYEQIFCVPDVGALSLGPPMVYEDKVTLETLVGYSFNGAANGPKTCMVECLDTGMFSPCPPAQPVRCSLPKTLPDNAHIMMPKTRLLTYQMTIDFICHPGFSTDAQPVTGPDNGAFKITCQADGTFSPPVQCVPVQCGEPPSFPNASFLVSMPKNRFPRKTGGAPKYGPYQKNSKTSGPKSKSGRYTLRFLEAAQTVEEAVQAVIDSQQKLKYTCNPGWSLSGFLRGPKVFWINCEGTGEFSKPRATCKNVDDCEGNRCSPNGFCTDNPSPTGNHSIDYTCNCDYGHEVKWVMGKAGPYQTCANPDDCPPDACTTAGYCRDLLNNYTCMCPLGYYEGWNGSVKDCLPKSCGIPAKRPFAEAETYAEQFFQDKMEYNCSTGYSLDGTADGDYTYTATCNVSADNTVALEYDGQCEPIKCADPVDVPHAQKDMTSLQFPQNVTYTCETGFTLDASCTGSKKFTMTCNAGGTIVDGEDSAILPDCKPVSNGNCTEAALPFAVFNNMEMFYGDEQNVTCKPGYSTNESNKALNVFTVKATAGCTLDIPSTCQPLKCGAAPVVDYTVMDNAATDIVFPTTVQYTTVTGYTLDGAANGSTKFSTSCNVDGEFDPIPYVPTRVSCGTAKMVDNAKAPPSVTKRFMDTVTYTCKTGFSTDGEPVSGANGGFNVTCQASGEFSPTKTCLPVKCANVPSPAKSTKITPGTSFVFKDVLHFMCLPGWSIDGKLGGQQNFTSKCQADGTFTATETCQNMEDCVKVPNKDGKCVDHAEPTGVHCDDYHMDCDSGFKEVLHPENCRECINIENCTKTACLPGSCEDKVNDFECVCPFGWVGTGGHECKRKSCGVPKTVPFAANAASEMFFMDTFEYKCKPGYTRTGAASGQSSFNVTCEGFGFVSGMQTCKPVKCTVNNIINTVQFKPNKKTIPSKTSKMVPSKTGGFSAVTTTFPNTVEYTCIDGYSTLGICDSDSKETFTMNCTEDGSMQFVDPAHSRCVANSAGHLTEEDVPNASFVPGTAVSYPDIVQVTCNPGYSTSPADKTKSSFSFKTTPECGFEQYPSCEPIICDPPPAVPNTDKSKAVVIFGQAVTYTCHTGYTLDGKPSRPAPFMSKSLGFSKPSPFMKKKPAPLMSTDSFEMSCYANGTFDPPKSCKPVQCGKPRNFSTSFAMSSKMLTFVDNKVTYKCVEGYTLDGKPDGVTEYTVTCMANGRQVGFKKCRPIECGSAESRVNSQPAIRMFNQILYQDPVKFLCNDGFSIAGKVPADTVRDTQYQEECLATGSITDLGSCADIDYCVTGLRHCGGGPSCTCIDGLHDYTCNCSIGYESKQAEDDTGLVRTMCVEINECVDENFKGNATCAPHGECVDAFNSYKCECGEGYKAVDMPGLPKGRQQCAPVECGALPSVAYAKRPALRKLVYPQNVSYTCDTGYTTDGDVTGPPSFTVSCQSNKKLTAVSECKPIKCAPALPAVDNAKTDFTGQLAYSTGSANYTCNEGYTTTGLAEGSSTVTIECNEFGEFVFTTVQTCKKVSCGLAPDVEFSEYEDGEKKFGDVTTYKCDPGYSVDGEAKGPKEFTISCLSDGNFSEVKACNPVSCGLPDSYANAKLDIVEKVYKETLEVSCDTGYSVTGEYGDDTKFLIRCSAGGNYSKVGEYESCVAVSCGVPEARAFSKPTSTDVVRYNESAVWQCVPPASVDGLPKGDKTFSLSCEANGNFSQASPIDCMDIDFCHPGPCGTHGTCFDCSTVGCGANGPPRGAILKKVHTNSFGNSATTWRNPRIPAPPGTKRAANPPSTGGKMVPRFNNFLQAGGPMWDSNGKYGCLCQEGYETKLNSEGMLTCSEDDCHNSKCGDGGSCVDLSTLGGRENAYKCNCRRGYVENTTADGFPTCTPIVCKGPFDLGNSYVKRHNKMLSKRVGFETAVIAWDTLMYECDEGYSTDGSISKSAKNFYVQCSQTGVLTHRRKCQKIKCDSQEVMPVATGVGVKFPESLQFGKPYSYGDVVTFDCETGYRVSPDSTSFSIQCLETSKFSKAEKCKPVSCGKPQEKILKANVKPSITTAVKFGDHVDMSCFYGHRTVFNAKKYVVHCMAEGEFTRSYSCKKVRCKNGLQFGQSLKKDCPDGMKTDAGLSYVIESCLADKTIQKSGVCKTHKLKVSGVVTDAADEANKLTGTQLTFTKQVVSRSSCSDLGWPFFGSVCGNGAVNQQVFKKTHQEAKDFCTQRDARLCTSSEIASSETFSLGVDLGSSEAWTATPCPEGYFTYKRPQDWQPPDIQEPSLHCVDPASTTVGVAGRCCADRTAATGGVVAPVTVAAGFGGKYTVDLVPGTYYVEGTYPDYINALVGLTVTKSIIGGPADIALAQAMKPDQMRIVMNWDEFSEDLDSWTTFGAHAYCEVSGPPEYQGCFGMYEVGWYHMYETDPETGVIAQLERDKVDGWGPETTYLSGIGKCQYSWTQQCLVVWSVWNYTPLSEKLKKSKGSLTVYRGSQQIMKFDIADLMENLPEDSLFVPAITINAATGEVYKGNAIEDVWANWHEFLLNDYR